MKENCLEIGIIQAFLDGELSHSRSAQVSGHIAVCDACAVMLAEAEDESAIVFPALEREFNTLVPTQRLWNKINDSIVTERDNRPFWQKIYAFLAIGLVNPSIAAAASLFIVIGVFSALWLNRPTTPAESAAVAAPQQTIASTAAATAPKISTRDPIVVDEIDTPPAAFRVERAAYRSEPRTVNSIPAVKTPAPMTTGYLPAEESYIKTISSLAKTVEEQKASGIMRPSERIAYERDMAVVNDAIAKMKTEIKRNPKNESAKQVLYSSYQNKIDLLNSVSQKEELVASLR